MFYKKFNFNYFYSFPRQIKFEIKGLYNCYIENILNKTNFIYFVFRHQEDIDTKYLLNGL